MKIKFTNPREIRMGSPHAIWRLKIQGEWIPDLPGDDWIGRSAQNSDGTLHALPRWSTEGNTPGYRLYIIDTKNKKIEIGDRIAGYCDHIVWNKNEFKTRSS